MQKYPPVLLLVLLPLVAHAEDVDLKAPEGFEVTLYADDDLAHDIYAMTIDSHGRVVVSGAGYVKTLHDDDGDGKADRATLFSETPHSGAHGMVFRGNDLLCTGDNMLMELVDKDGDGKADGAPKRWASLRNPEHGANGLTIGPDGWIYVICGNDAGLKNLRVAKTSPVQNVQCGGVVRFSADGKQAEVYAHGMRNPYDLAFDEFGFLYTVDADGERDQHLPWYTPNRLFDISQGAHHGWIQEGWRKSWNRPAYFFDNVERMVEIGRGSPTGVEAYRHDAFPAEYRDQIYSCCWTLGKVYRFPRENKGASGAAEMKVFLETTGEVGFAPVDIAVGPSGDLFVAIGGRRTRGGVFRVRYTGEVSQVKQPEDLHKLLTAPQPLAEWSRSSWRKLAKEAGQKSIAAATSNENLSIGMRVRAIEILVSEFGGIDDDLANDLLKSDNERIRAKAVWAVGRSQGDDEILAKATFDESPLVRRYAWEGLQNRDKPEVAKLNHAREVDRRVLRTAYLSGLFKPEANESLRVDEVQGMLTAKHFSRALKAFYFNEYEFTENVDWEQLDALRLMQISLGDVNVESPEPQVYAGYSFRAKEEELAAARLEFNRYPPSSTNRNVQAEIVRIAAGVGASIEHFQPPKWLGDAETPAPEDIHYLIAYSRMRGERSSKMTDLIAHLLVMLPIKMETQYRYASRNWPLRVGEAYEELVRRDEQLLEAILRHPKFGDPGHSLYVLRAPKEQRADAARRLIASVQKQKDILWDESLLSVAKLLPREEAERTLRDQWSDARLQDEIALFLAGAPHPQDRAKFVRGLASVQPDVVRRCAQALSVLPEEATDAELLAAMRSLQRHLADKRFRLTRRAVHQLLSVWTDQSREIEEADDLVKAYQPWFDWFEKSHPNQFKQLTGFTNDGESWRKKLAAVDWDRGSATAGKTVFEKKLCHRCHAASDSLGPDLKGAAGRFSRDDLFAAIVDPSRNVSPLYQTTRVEVDNGKVHFGIPVYTSPDGTLLQTGPGATVRIAGDEIIDIRKSATSLMPTGLLNDVSEKGLADLYAYLRTLK